MSLLSRDSILLYGITSRKSHVRKTMTVLEATAQHARVLVLRSARDVRELLAWIEKGS